MFACTVVGCGKVFTLKYNLTRHAKIHDDVKLACNLCSKSFTCKHNHEN